MSDVIRRFTSKNWACDHPHINNTRTRKLATLSKKISGHAPCVFRCTDNSSATIIAADLVTSGDQICRGQTPFSFVNFLISSIQLYITLRYFVYYDNTHSQRSLVANATVLLCKVLSENKAHWLDYNSMFFQTKKLISSIYKYSRQTSGPP